MLSSPTLCPSRGVLVVNAGQTRIIEGRHLREAIQSAALWTRGSKSVTQNERKYNTMGAGWFKSFLTRKTAMIGLSSQVRQGALWELYNFPIHQAGRTWSGGDGRGSSRTTLRASEFFHPRLRLGY